MYFRSACSASSVVSLEALSSAISSYWSETIGLASAARAAASINFGLRRGNLAVKRRPLVAVL